MKALILSVSAGGGHIHAANAIKSYILLNSPNSNVEIIDTLKYINPILDKVIIGSYIKTIKMTPSLFGKLYEYAENDDSLALVSSKFNEFISSKLLPLIKDFQPDIILCTHPFPAEMVSILKKKQIINVPILCILTDYSPHNFWIHEGIDSYVVSNSDMVEEMKRRNVTANKIHDFGIPIEPSFFIKYKKDKTLKELGFSKDKLTILIMGGSLGMGKISTVYENICKIDDDFQVIVITGNNSKLYSELNSLKESCNKPTKIIGYTKEVNKYMQVSDLLITKPGGITITEALATQLPIALFSPIPGQEEKNADFLLKHNLAIDLDDCKNCKEKIELLISNPNILKKMKKNSLKYSKPNCGEDIYNLICSLIKVNNNL